MYVGTVFHGEGARLRPIFHDMTYFDWQIKLLSHLKKLNMEVIYKPHPEGASKVPDDLQGHLALNLLRKGLRRLIMRSMLML